MCIHDSTCPTSLYRAQVQSKTDAAVERIHKGRTRQSSLPDLLQDLLVGIGTHIQGAGDRFKTGMTTLAHDAQKDQGIIEPPEDAGFHRIDLDAASRSMRREAADEVAPQGAEQILYRTGVRVGFPEARLRADGESMIACVSRRPTFVHPAHTGCPGIIRVIHWRVQSLHGARRSDGPALVMMISSRTNDR